MSFPESRNSKHNQQIASQNVVVDGTVDGIVQKVGEQPGAENRSDWKEIQQTVEMFALANLQMGAPGEQEKRRPLDS